MSMVGVPNSLHKHLNNAGFSIHSVSMFSTTLDWKSATLFIIPGKCSAESVKFLCIAHNHIFLVSCMRWCFVLAIRLMQATAVVLSSFSLMWVSCLSLQRACNKNKAAWSSLTLMCKLSSSCDQWPLVVLPDSTIWPPQPVFDASDSIQNSGLGVTTCLIAFCMLSLHQAIMSKMCCGRVIWAL